MKEFKQIDGVIIFRFFAHSADLSVLRSGRQRRHRRHRRHRRRLTGRDRSATPAVRSANQGGAGEGKVRRTRAIYSFIGLSWEDRVGRGCVTTGGRWWRAGRWKRVRGGVREVQERWQQGS